MKIHIFESADQSGLEAARESARIINEAIAVNGTARIVLSTGASQFEFLEHVVKMDIAWEKVEMFHLDEYIGLPVEHPASFRKYLKERFLQHVNIGTFWLVDGEGDTNEVLDHLNREISKAPVDLALIGIGENAHIAFNDPPADFEDERPFKVVDLSDTCKMQQVGEGWFATMEDVPKQAISMSVQQILKSRNIISVVPRQSKARAIQDTLKNEVDVNTPATIMKTHANWSLYLDKQSSSLIYAWC
ncbi:glucosamine-6-phosphate deaminase [Paenibacillus agaridevorans]|uniref:Glucosamine-6-phosphate deaminase n=1 Tax=Paenibacillus agaridevorans TaxID=171404 RepID=A0A2R5EW39_9BACL|nr:glucosamine-6-phosphate deaminase [Paenibacillus agaridevorans]GBG10335.1 glucosamine-6-phosphate deaminase [Paenibacillus agaridevorans]